jgi:hypothetical protein
MGDVEIRLEELHSLKNPQLEPSSDCYLILQNHGRSQGGWGPTAVHIAGLPMGPVVYTGSDPATIEALGELAKKLRDKTGKQTKLVKFSKMTTLAEFDAFRID